MTPADWIAAALLLAGLAVLAAAARQAIKDLNKLQ